MDADRAQTSAATAAEISRVFIDLIGPPEAAMINPAAAAVELSRVRSQSASTAGQKPLRCRTNQRIDGCTAVTRFAEEEDNDGQTRA
jgi:hypothetical protein